MNTACCSLFLGFDSPHRRASKLGAEHLDTLEAANVLAHLSSPKLDGGVAETQSQIVQRIYFTRDGVCFVDRLDLQNIYNGNIVLN